MENAARLFAALANAADGAFVIDETQCILYWNDAAEEILGYTADEMVGRNCCEMLGGRDEKDRPVCYFHCRVVMATLTGNGVANYDACVRARSGEPRWINVSILAFPGHANDASPLIVHLFRDVTEKKRNEAFIQQVLDAAERLRERVAAPTAVPVSTQAQASDLTERERDILTLLVQGLSTNDIARSLSISPTTTRNHIQNILHKLHVHSRLEAVTYAIEHGLASR